MRDDGTRERFLAAIAEQVALDGVAEVHVFAPIKQGATESGVAVVAVQEGSRNGGTADDGTDKGGTDESGTDESGTADDGTDDSGTDESGTADDGTDESGTDESGTVDYGRLAVYTAKYRLTLKGPDRGKWEFSIQAEADAPLVTVDKVVRGVQRRSGDVEDAEKLTGEEFRALIPPREPAENRPI